jgi:hypothetical protein
MLVTVAERSKAFTVFARSERDRGFESHTGHGCLMCVHFSVFALFCV